MLKYIVALTTLILTRSAILALLAFFVASIYERFSSLGPGAINPLGAGKRKSVFLETVFLLMGSLAKADGRVSEDEVQHTEHIIAQLGLNNEHREQAINLFKKGAAADFDLEASMDKFNQVCGSTRSLRQALLAYLITLAFADGEFHPAEEKLLEQIAVRLKINQAAFQQLLEMIRSQSHFSGGQVPTQNALATAYKALGVSDSVGDQDLKKAYRKLMSQNHPDKLIGQGLPEDMIKMATERSKEIQKAYELIKSHREKSK